ncbi:MAG TPA: hypothetical protein VHP14_14545 [Anaerolineales bacterium]|nr:hypothetical protein [Anaerolineales bacterium]
MKRLCSIVVVFVLLAFPSSVRADVAPPYNPPGSNPQPGVETTQVRMVAETVTIEVQKDIEPKSLGQARVTADFTMYNLSNADESMAARFPISASDGRSSYPEISNLEIKIDGKQIQYRRASYPEIRYPNEKMVPWAEFDITFPAGTDVSISVAYDLDGTGYYPYTAFYYILETGAGWKDTIGSADIILRLPYEANLQNVVVDYGIGWATTPTGGVFQGNEVRWHFENFEPGREQNMEFALVAPAEWESVLTARANAEKYPNDGEVWGMLGKTYKQVLQMSKGNREDAGGQELYQLSVEAYEKCLSLKPKDAQWHAGFADLLASHVMWNTYTMNTDPTTYRALDEIHTALELAPNDPIVREVAMNITYMLYGGIVQNGDSFDFPWLTQTPTPYPPTLEVVLADTATVAPGTTPTPTEASAPPVKPTPTQPPVTTPTSAPQKSSPLCGSATFLPLLAIVWFTRNNYRSTRGTSKFDRSSHKS